MRNTFLFLTIAFFLVTAAFAGGPDDEPSVDSSLQSTSSVQSNTPVSPDLDASTSKTDSGVLHVVWSPGYLWTSGLKGNVGVKGLVVPVNASFSDILNELNIGYMGSVDLRKRRLGLLTDLAYTKLSTKEQSTPYGLLYSTARTRSKMFFFDPEFYGRLVNTPKFSVDAFAGLRVWRLDNGIDLGAGSLPALSLDNTQGWVDPLLGARFRANFPKGVFVSFKGDAGIGSNQTWQIYTGGGKEFRGKYSVFLGYRRLDVHYRTSNFLYDTSMDGALLGFVLRFR